jgi:hypothetical protein
VIYSKFVTELVNATAFGVEEIVKDKVYELKRLFYYDKPEYRRGLFTVCADREKMEFECECGKFQKDGILCCHILRLFTQWDVVRIPDDYIVPRWTIEYREKEMLKQKEVTCEMHGSSSSETALRYAMLMNNVNDVCADLSKDARKSKIFIEEVQKLHRKLMADEIHRNIDEEQPVQLKDPPVIKKKKANSKKGAENTEFAEPDTTTAIPSVNIWVNDDGSISKPVEQLITKSKSVKKRNQPDDGMKTSFKDPPVSNAKSVNKGARLKPQYEKRTAKKKSGKQAPAANK